MAFELTDTELAFVQEQGLEEPAFDDQGVFRLHLDGGDARPV